MKEATSKDFLLLLLQNDDMIINTTKSKKAVLSSWIRDILPKPTANAFIQKLQNKAILLIMPGDKRSQEEEHIYSFHRGQSYSVRAVALH